MEMTPIVIITLFSADKVRLDDESVSRVLNGDYPVRVKSKILATIREFVPASDKKSIVGFLPVTRESRDVTKFYPIPFPEDITQDHYGELALYLAPEVPCSVVSDLIVREKNGHLACKSDFVRGKAAVIIGDSCDDWSEIATCLEEAGAESVKCISIVDNK